MDRRIDQSIDAAEVERFSATASSWWDPDGPYRPLHKLNPVRLRYIRDQILAQHPRAGNDDAPLAGLRILDIGCGGGLLCEPLTRLGAAVTGIDASAKTIAVASAHAASQGLAIDYRVATAEALVEDGERFDVVLNMEVVEHVADRTAFIASCGKLLTPDGLMILSSINRTPQAFAFAIIGAEYVLNWLPRGTHRFSKLVRPDELRDDLVRAGLRAQPPVGVVYDLWSDNFRMSGDTSINYMMSASAQNA